MADSKVWVHNEQVDGWLLYQHCKKMLKMLFSYFYTAYVSQKSGWGRHVFYLVAPKSKLKCRQARGSIWGWIFRGPHFWSIYFSLFPCSFFMLNTSKGMLNPAQVLSLLIDYLPLLLRAHVMNLTHMDNPESCFYVFFKASWLAP